MPSHDDLHDSDGLHDPDVRVRAFESIRSDKDCIEPDALDSLADRHHQAPLGSHNGARAVARVQARARCAARIGTPTAP